MKIIFTPTATLTWAAGFRVLSANHYTTDNADVRYFLCPKISAAFLLRK